MCAAAAAITLSPIPRPPDELGLELEALQAFLASTGPVAVVDLETTGLPDGGRAEILEIGAVLLDPGRPEVQTLSTLVRPRQPVPRAVRALTGIRDADVADAPRIEAVAESVATALEGRTIVAHNADFERYFLERFVSPRLSERRFLDTQDLLACAHPDAPDLRLETFTQELLGRTERHRALEDALDTARVISHAAAGARSAVARYVVARDALELYDPESAWLPLLSGAGLAPAATEPAQHVPIPDAGEPPVPFDADAIAATLADEARGRRHFPGYRVREQQVRMAREFVRVLDEGGRLLLEGGTGVGKSLAYLAAVIPFAMERAAGGIREPIVVSTRTKLLQDQLLSKDIPAAAAMLGYPGLRAVSIKGRANYVCARRCEQVLAEGRDARLFAEDRVAYAVLRTSAKLRPHGEIGTLPGALLVRYPPLRDLRRRAVAARAEQCTREQCGSEPSCPFGRRRAALAGAHLVVANHDLLLRWPPDYPAFTHAIADEAHELCGVADEVYALEVRPDEVLETVDELFGREESRHRRQVRGRLEAPLEQVRAWRGDLRQDLAALGEALQARAGEFGGVQLPAGASRIMPAAAALAAAAADRLALVADIADGLDERRGEEDAKSEAVARATAELREAARALRLAFDSGEDAVAAFEGLTEPFDRWRLALRQVAPAKTFHESFLSRLESFACVSASLFVHGDARAALGELEIDSRTQSPVWSVAVESPFRYADHMRVVALDEAGDLVENTALVLADLARRLDGRTLGLFTSLRRMRDVRDRLADLLHGEGFDLLMPRRATDDPAALVQRFQRARGGGILLGARTFWQGLDIPGPALQAVVIEKLPFEVPTELRRRRDARMRAEGLDPFSDHALGKMLLNLKQMAGRLIRSEDDRGIAVIVDARPDRPYFRRLAAGLPPGCAPRLVLRGEIAAVLDELDLG
jgi:ATP-dependent DNA helicase DinG